MKTIITKSLFALFSFILILVSCQKPDEGIDLHSNPGYSFLDIESEGYQVDLNAEAAPEGQKGTWRIYMGENGRFDDVNVENTTFYGEPGEKYLLGWEVSSGDSYKASTISVSFKPLKPELQMVVKDTIYGNISLYLKAEDPKFGAEGLWEILEGENARIINSEGGKAEFIGVENKSYTLRWSLKFGSKTESIDFSFYTDTLQAYAGEDRMDIITEKNAQKFTTLNAFLPAGGVGTWEIIKGEEARVYSYDDPYTALEGVADSIYTLSWKVKVDDYESVDTLKIRFRGKWGSFTDERDGKDYRYVEINGLRWMADNFDYNAPFTQYGRSWYYGQSLRAKIKDGHAVESEADMKKYGRLYNYVAAVEEAPEGWRLPTHDEYTDLETMLGGDGFAWKKIIPGGETGLELEFAGYVFYSNDSPTSRDTYTMQDIVGAYWTSDFIITRNESKVRVIYSDYNILATGPFHIYYSGASVRYVQDL